MEDSTTSEDELLALTYQGGKIDPAGDRVDRLFATLRARFNKYTNKKKGFGDSSDATNTQSGDAASSGNRKNASSRCSEVDPDGTSSINNTNNNNNNTSAGGPQAAETGLRGPQSDFKLTSLLQAVQRNTDGFSGDEATPRVTYGGDPASGLDLQDLSANGGMLPTGGASNANNNNNNNNSNISHTHRRVSSIGTDANAASILQSSVRSAPPITAGSKKSNYYWESRELYIAAEELCCYLNGGVNYRNMCKYYQQTLHVLLRLLREDLQLLREVEVLPRGTVAEALGQLKSLLTEAAGLLESSGIDVPAPLREQTARLEQLYDGAATPGSALGGKAGSPPPAASLLDRASPITPGGVEGDGASVKLDDDSLKKSRRPTLPAPKKEMNLSNIFKEFQPFPIGDLDPADAALVSGGDHNKDGSAAANTNSSACHRNTSNDLANTTNGFSATFAAHLEDVVAQPQDTSGGSIVNSNTRTHSLSVTATEGTQQTSPSQPKKSSIMSFNLDKAKKTAGEEKPPTPVPHPPTSSAQQPPPPPRGATNPSTPPVAPLSLSPIPGPPSPQPQEDADEPQPHEEGEGAPAPPHRRLSDTEEPNGPLSTKERLRRVEQLYGEGYYLDGMQLIKDVLGTVFRWEYDQDPVTHTTPAAVFNTSTNPQEQQRRHTSDAPAVTTESAFLSFKKDYQEYLAPLLLPAAHAANFVRATADTTPLRSEYLMECLSYHIKPNDVLLSTFEKVKKDRDVTRLDLQSVAVGDVGMLPFSLVLPRLYKLKTLDLRQAGIQEEGLEALSLGLCYHPSLEVLNLSHNNLDDRCLPALLRIVRTVPHLQTIFLFGCPISSETREEVLQEVQRPTTHLVYTPQKRKRRVSPSTEGRWSVLSTPLPRVVGEKLVPAPVATASSPTRGQSAPVATPTASGGGGGAAVGALTPKKPPGRRPSKNPGSKVLQPPRTRTKKKV